MPDDVEAVHSDWPDITLRESSELAGWVPLGYAGERFIRKPVGSRTVVGRDPTRFEASAGRRR
jgi:hypothetical protein